jgi:hypothetical protein
VGADSICPEGAGGGRGAKKTNQGPPLSQIEALLPSPGVTTRPRGQLPRQGPRVRLARRGVLRVSAPIKTNRRRPVSQIGAISAARTVPGRCWQARGQPTRLKPLSRRPVNPWAT